MRTVLGSVALSVGGLLLLVSIFIALQSPDLPRGVVIASGGVAVVLLVASVLLIRTTNQLSGRGMIVTLSIVFGLGGLIFALASKNYEFGKYCGIEGLSQSYKLTVRIFGTVLHEESAAAVQQTEGDHTITKPPQDLDTKMTYWELGLDAALVAGGALVGGLIGLLIRTLTSGPAKVGT